MKLIIMPTKKGTAYKKGKKSDMKRNPKFKFAESKVESSDLKPTQNNVPNLFKEITDYTMIFSRAVFEEKIVKAAEYQHSLEIQTTNFYFEVNTEHEHITVRNKSADGEILYETSDPQKYSDLALVLIDKVNKSGKN